jgi:hypothetical protein
MIVGLVGFMGSGKGTAGDILASHGFKRDSFAAPVKDAAAAIFGWDRALLEGDTDVSRKFRETPCPFWSEVYGRPLTPREVLQKMGTEAGRNVFHPDLWTRALERRVTTDGSDKHVITDVRFPNEMKLVRELGGIVIEVYRGASPEWYLTAQQLNENTNWDGTIQHMSDFPKIHYSEWAFIGSPEITHEIANIGTVEDLEYNLLKAIGS